MKTIRINNMKMYKNTLFMLLAVLTISFTMTSCNDHEEEAATAEIDRSEDSEVVVDYNNMSWDDQEADMTTRIEELRGYSANMTDGGTEYELEVDNLEAEMSSYQEKRKASDADPDNEDLKAAAQQAADEFRMKADNLKSKAHEAQADVQEMKDDVKADVQNEKEDLKSDIDDAKAEVKGDIKVAKADVKSNVQEIKEGVKADVTETKTDLKSSIKDKKAELKSDIKEGAKEVKADIKEAFGK